MALLSSQSSITPQLGEKTTVDNLGLLDTAAEIARWKAEREEGVRQKQVTNLNLQFVPVPVTNRHTAENVVKLYLLVQKRNITPIFEYGDLGIQAFNATLKMHSKVFTADGPFPSKKEAKEAAAKLGLEYLNGNPDLSSHLPKAGSKPSGGPADIAELNTQAQRHKIAPPEYLFNEISQGKFSVSLVLAGTTFEERGPFPSKKLAKEAIAKLGLAHLQHVSTPAIPGASSVELAEKLQSLVDRYCLDKPIFDFIELAGTPLQYRTQLRLDGEVFQDVGPFMTKEEATRAITNKGVEHLKKKYIENEENWIELLNLFSQASTRWQPIYEDFQETTTRQNMWGSEVTIPLRAEPFGRRDLPFGSKKIARQNAAREAVQWLREEGLVSKDRPSTKKQKRKSSSADSDGSRGDGISYSQQVNDICIQNTISVPIYELKADTEPPFYSGFARFTNFTDIGGGRPIGKVENIYGKKKAKEAIARNVLRVLDEYVKTLEKVDQDLLREAGFEAGNGMMMKDVPIEA